MFTKRRIAFWAHAITKLAGTTSLKNEHNVPYLDDALYDSRSSGLVPDNTPANRR